MSLDVWGVKLKDNSKWETAFWEDIDEDFKESNIIPKGNCFQERITYTRRHDCFIHDVLSIKGFVGDPCCSREVMTKVSEQLQEWLSKNPNTNWNEIYNPNDFYGGYELSVDEIKDLVEYIKLLDDNGFVMWFSN